MIVYHNLIDAQHLFLHFHLGDWPGMCSGWELFCWCKIYFLSINTDEDFHFHLIRRKGDRRRTVVDQLFQVSFSTTDLPPSHPPPHPPLPPQLLFAYRVVGAQRVEGVGPAHEEASLSVQQHLHEVAALILQRQQTQGGEEGSVKD